MAQPDNYMSWNRILDVIKKTAERHQMIVDFSVGDEATRGHSKDDNKELDTPYLFADPVQAGYVFGQGSGIVAKEYTVRLFVADKHSDNAKNDQDITSDTEEILSDVVQWISTEPDLLQFKVQSGVTPARLVRHTTIHEMFGHELDMVVRVPYKYCFNDLPIGPDPGTC